MSYLTKRAMEGSLYDSLVVIRLAFIRAGYEKL